MKYLFISLLISLTFLSCSDSSPDNCDFIGEWCSTSIFSECDGITTLTFESSGEFVLSTLGIVTGAETEWSSGDCQTISITGDDGQGGNPQVFRFEVLSISGDTMRMTGLGLELFLRVG